MSLLVRATTHPTCGVSESEPWKKTRTNRRRRRGVAPSQPKRSGLNRLLFDMRHPAMLLFALPILAVVIAVMAIYVLSHVF